MLLMLVFYSPDFGEKSVSEISSMEDETNGLFFGRIDYVIKNEPSTNFILNDGNIILVYYPKKTDLKKNDFVKVYATKRTLNGKIELYAHKVARG
jgi:hypothetical protein